MNTDHQEDVMEWSVSSHNRRTLNYQNIHWSLVDLVFGFQTELKLISSKSLCRPWLCHGPQTYCTHMLTDWMFSFLMEFFCWCRVTVMSWTKCPSQLSVWHVLCLWFFSGKTSSCSFSYDVKLFCIPCFIYYLSNTSLGCKIPCRNAPASPVTEQVSLNWDRDVKRFGLFAGF